MERIRRNDLILVGGLALVLRLIYISQLANTPFFESPIVDADFHNVWARDILEKGIGHEGVFFRAPLYPYFLALVYSLTNGSFLLARIVQAFLGSLTAILTYLIAQSVTGKRTVALIAGIGAALYGMLVYYDGELLVETLFIPLFLTAVYFYSISRKSHRSTGLLTSGLFLGLATITRATALVIIPVIVLDIILRRSKDGFKMALLPRAFRIFAFLTGCFLPIFPVTWHNVYQGGDFVLIGSYGGVNFYIGNNPESDGLHSHIPGLGCNWDLPMASFRAYQAEGRYLLPSEVSAFYSKLAWRFIANRPFDWAKLTLRKFVAFWNRLEISNNRDLYFFRNETKILPVLSILGFWIVGPLGLLGWWISWRKKLTPNWFNWIMPLYMVSVISFFVTARFRAPVIPFLLIYSGITFSYLANAFQPVALRQKIFYIGILIVLGLFVNANPYRFQKENLAHSYFSLGNAFLKSGDLDGATAAYHSAIAADSAYGLVHLNLGVVQYRRGDKPGAEREYLEELDLNPRNAMALNNLGVLRMEEGKLEAAKLLYERAHEFEPYFQDAKVNLAECLFKLGMERAKNDGAEDALTYFQRACFLQNDNPLYHYNYALSLGKMGYGEPAAEHLQRTLELKPDFTPAKELLDRLRAQSSLETNLSP